MTAADRPAFSAALAAVYALYRVEISAAVAEIWWRCLQSYDIAAVSEALGRHAMNPDSGQFLPKPADVVRQLEGGTQDQALIAWHQVLDAMRRIGSYESVAFEDPLINRVLLDLGGWAWFGQQSSAELPFIEKRFRDAYRAWRNRGLPADSGPQHLPGVIEQQNAALGCPPPDPRRIAAPRGAKALPAPSI